MLRERLTSYDGKSCNIEEVQTNNSLNNHEYHSNSNGYNFSLNKNNHTSVDIESDISDETIMTNFEAFCVTHGNVLLIAGLFILFFGLVINPLAFASNTRSLVAAREMEDKLFLLSDQLDQLDTVNSQLLTRVDVLSQTSSWKLQNYCISRKLQEQLN
jgi:hypothetical protein